VAEPLQFGVELRRLRLAADMSLARFAESVHYSKGYLSRIETGRQPPTAALARRCDALLGAGGRLAALVHDGPRIGRGDCGPRSILVSAMTGGLDPVAPVARRQLLAAGTAWAVGMANTDAVSKAADAAPVEALGELFAQMRRLGQLTASDAMVPMLVAQTRVVSGLAAQAGAASRASLLILASRFAEFTGWMAQESGDEVVAMQWTSQAVEMANAAGDRDLAGYASIRHALITMYRNDGAQTVALARCAQSPSLPSDVREQAARREAQGHALLGDHDSAMQCLDRARALRDRESTPTAGSLGPTHLPDAIEMVTGWCLFDVGRPREAAAILDRQVETLAADADRSRARYGMRAALAHSAAGEIERACDGLGPLLNLADAIDSATIDADMRRLAAELGRYRAAASVKAMLPRLTASLHRSAR
jgi:tetratricopeptide (TPR) repeat protein